MVNSGSFDSPSSEGEPVKGEYTQTEEDDSVPRSGVSPGDYAAVMPDHEDLPLVERDDGLNVTMTSLTDLNQDESDGNRRESVRTSLQCSVPLDKVKNVLNLCKRNSASNINKQSTFQILENYVKQPSKGQEEAVVVSKPPVKRLLCLFCDRTFTSNNLKQKHVDRCHSSGQTRRSSSRTPSHNQSATACCFCSKLNHTDHTLHQLLEHLVQEHSNRYYACLQCQERFVTSQLLTDHNASHDVQMDKMVDAVDKMAIVAPKAVVVSSPVENVTVTQPTNVTVDVNEMTTVITEPEDSQPEVDKVIEGKHKPTKVKNNNKKVTVPSIRNGVRTRATLKQLNELNRKRKTKLATFNTELTNPVISKPTAVPSTSVFSLVNAFIYKYEKIYNHASDSIKDVNSVQFNAVFDKEFYAKTVNNIHENLLHHLDGKLDLNLESENRISSFEHTSTVETEVKAGSVNMADNFGCDLSLNAITPVATLLSSTQYGEDFDSQIEYGAKASQKSKKVAVVKYKFTNKKYNSFYRERDTLPDLTRLDMWTQLNIKNRQHSNRNEDSEAKQRVNELNQILDQRGPFEDPRLEANAFQFLELRRKSKDHDNSSDESIKDIYFILEEMLTRVEEIIVTRTESEPESELSLDEPDQNLDIPNYLNLQKTTNQTTELKSQKDVLELSGEWARPRIYICATCGLKLPNLKALDDHKNTTHPHIWSTHYEFVGSQSHLYRHLSIPGLGKVGIVESSPVSRIWKRSTARTCSKCLKHCHNLGELHKHILECGGDWTWMYARKKCKYRPYGTRSKRRRQRGYKRSVNPEMRRELKPKIKPLFIGPRPKPSKPSDAETIERMLANLPPKRHRKIISMRDGIQRPRKPYKRKLVNQTVQSEKVSNKSTTKKGHYNPPQISLKSALKLRSRAVKTVNTELNDNVFAKESDVTQQIIGNKKQIRNKRMMSRILGSKIFDTTAVFVSRRRLVQAITQNNLIRKTRLRTKVPLNEEQELSKNESKTKNIQPDNNNGVIKELKTVRNNSEENTEESNVKKTPKKANNKRNVPGLNKSSKKLKPLTGDEVLNKSNKKLKSLLEDEVLNKTNKKLKFLTGDEIKKDTICAIIEEVIEMAVKEEGRFAPQNISNNIKSTKTSKKTIKVAKQIEVTPLERDKNVQKNSNTIKNIITKKTNKLVQNIKSLKKTVIKSKSAKKSESVATKLIKTFSAKGSKRKKEDLNFNPDLDKNQIAESELKKTTEELLSPNEVQRQDLEVMPVLEKVETVANSLITIPESKPVLFPEQNVCNKNVNKENDDKTSGMKSGNENATNTLNKLKSKIKRSGRGLNDCIAMLRCKLEQKYQNDLSSSDLFPFNFDRSQKNDVYSKEQIGDIHAEPITLPEKSLYAEKPVLEIPVIKKDVAERLEAQTEYVSPEIQTNVELNYVLSATLTNCLMECVKNKCEELKINVKTVANRKIGSVRKRKPRTEDEKPTPKLIPNIPLLNKVFVTNSSRPLVDGSSDEDMPLSKFVNNFTPETQVQSQLNISVAKKKRKSKKKSKNVIKNVVSNIATSLQEQIKLRTEINDSLNRKTEEVQIGMNKLNICVDKKKRKCKKKNKNVVENIMSDIGTSLQEQVIQHEEINEYLNRKIEEMPAEMNELNISEVKKKQKSKIKNKNVVKNIMSVIGTSLQEQVKEHTEVNGFLNCKTQKVQTDMNNSINNIIEEVIENKIYEMEEINNKVAIDGNVSEELQIDNTCPEESETPAEIMQLMSSLQSQLLNIEDESCDDYVVNNTIVEPTLNNNEELINCVDSGKENSEILQKSNNTKRKRNKRKTRLNRKNTRRKNSPILKSNTNQLLEESLEVIAKNMVDDISSDILNEENVLSNIREQFLSQVELEPDFIMENKNVNVEKEPKELQSVESNEQTHKASDSEDELPLAFLAKNFNCSSNELLEGNFQEENCDFVDMSEYVVKRNELLDMNSSTKSEELITPEESNNVSCSVDQPFRITVKSVENLNREIIDEYITDLEIVKEVISDGIKDALENDLAQNESSSKSPSIINEKQFDFLKTPLVNNESEFITTPDLADNALARQIGNNFKLKVRKSKKNRRRVIPKSLIKGKRKEEELNNIVMCDICNKVFKRKENLACHKRTLTHIAKLSEIEARENLAKLALENCQTNDVSVDDMPNLNSEIKETTTTAQDYSLCYLDDLENIQDSPSPLERIEHAVPEILNLETEATVNTLPPIVVNSSNSNLKLVDIINEVLDKPINNLNIVETDYLSRDLDCSPKTFEIEPKKYKSLGERKSFDSDNFVFSQKSDDDYRPINNGLLNKQLSLLANIVDETNPNLNFIEDSVSLLSTNFDDAMVEQTEKDLFISDYSDKLKEPLNVDVISFAKPNHFSNFENISPNFVKPINNYDDISQPQLEEPKKDNPTRNLNRDEELFLECCSLLKSGSEMSGVSKKSTKHIPLTNSSQSNDSSWTQQKQCSQFMQRNSFTWLAQNSRVNTPIGESFVSNDWSNSNSAVSSEWLSQKAPSPDGPTENNTLAKKPNELHYSDIQFEDISVDSSMEASKTLMAIESTSNSNIPLNFHNVDFSSSSLNLQPKRVESIEFEETSIVKDFEVDEEEQYFDVEQKDTDDELEMNENCDEDLKKKVVSAFGGLMAKALSNRLHAVVRKSQKTRTKREHLNSVQSSITDYIVPEKRSKSNSIDSDSSDGRKKLITKGAMKVFEGLKVSIPTQDLNLSEVFNDIKLINTKDNEQIQVEKQPKKEGKTKNGKVKSLFNRFGNKLGLRETKKKQTKRTPKSKNVVTKKSFDVYDFEESQDNSFGLSNETFSVFRNSKENIEKIEELDVNINSDNKYNLIQSDSDTDRYYDSMSFEEMSLSSESIHEISEPVKNKPVKKKNSDTSKENQKKCVIMGRIFKNASKPKLEDKIPEIRDFPNEENSELVETYVNNGSNLDYTDNVETKEVTHALTDVTVVNNATSKMSKKEMDLLFDKLLQEERNFVNNEIQPACENKIEDEVNIQLDKIKKPKDIKTKVLKNKKRSRQNSGDSASSDEFKLGNKSSRKHHKTPRRTSKVKKEGGINLEQEMKECIGVAGRKSQRKCTSGKQNILAEFWSSDESSFEEVLNQLANSAAEEIQNEVKQNGDLISDINDLETPEVNGLTPNKDVYEFESDLDLDLKVPDTIFKSEFEENPEPKSKELTKTNKTTKSKPPKVRKSIKGQEPSIECENEQKRKMIHKRKRMLDDSQAIDCLAATRKKRNASEMLYYWSSSSDDELDMIEVKPIREDTDDDRPMQHGWIVGDSPKKLVTMLAQAKGKKIESDSVKEQNKKNRIT